MSYEIERNIDNIIWRVESITPTYVRAGLKAAFTYIGNTRLENNESVALSRSFRLNWDGHSGYSFPICGTRRFADHNFTLQIYYNIEAYTEYLANVIMANDQRDVGIMLDNSANFLGYNATNTTTDIGLENRYVASAKRLDDGELQVLELSLLCTIRED